MKNYPNTNEEDGDFSIKFVPSIPLLKEQPLEMVLDFDQLGKVIGIEIINLTFHAGKKSLKFIEESVRTEGDELKYSYDEDSDSFYLRLKSGRSVNQKTVQGSMFLDKDGQILAFRAGW